MVDFPPTSFEIGKSVLCQGMQRTLCSLFNQFASDIASKYATSFKSTLDAFDEFMTHTTGELPDGSDVSDAFDDAKDFIDDIAEMVLSDDAQQILDCLKQCGSFDISDFFNGADLEDIADKMANATDVADFFSSMGGAFKDYLTDLMGNAFSSVAEGLEDTLFDAVSGLFDFENNSSVGTYQKIQCMISCMSNICDDFDSDTYNTDVLDNMLAKMGLSMGESSFEFDFDGFGYDSDLSDLLKDYKASFTDAVSHFMTTMFGESFNFGYSTC